jgi:phosphoglycolate phosphatase
VPGTTARERDVLVFDLDGTLVDSAPDIRRGLNAMLEATERRPLSLVEVRAIIGDGATRLVERAFARTGAPISPAALADEVERFLVHYAAGRHALTRPYPGVVETLAELRVRGHRLAVCTMKPIAATLELLDALHLASHFAAVTGGDSLSTRKPDPGHFIGTLDLIGAGLASAVMVGDSANDVATARAAGVPAVVVSYGYATVPAADLGADAVIDAFADILAWLDSPRGRP